MRKFIIAVGMFVVASFAASSASAAQTTPQGDAGRGEAVYERVGCYQCHGYQGQGGRHGPRIVAPVLLVWPAFQAFVRATDRQMPPYTQTVLPEQDLADIYAHLQTVLAGPDFRSIPLLNELAPTASAE